MALLEADVALACGTRIFIAQVKSAQVRLLNRQ